MKKQKIPELVEKKKEGGYRYNLHSGQIEAWYSPAKYVFLYAGIQSGKCNYKNTLIPIKGGERKKIKNVSIDDVVLSIDDDFKIVESRVNHVIDSGILPTYELKTASGRHIIVSETHPFLTKDGWKEIKDIDVKDFVAVPRTLPIEGTKEFDESWLKLIGYLLGDGGISSISACFSNIDPMILEDVQKCLPNNYQLKHSDRCTYRIQKNKRGGRNAVITFLRRIGMMGHTAHTKSIPKFVFTLKNEYVALVINRLFACDGWVDTRGIGYTSVSKQMMYDVQHLLLRFGIVSRVRHRYSKCNGKMFPNYALTIVRKSDMIRFQEHVGIFSKDEKLAALIRTKEREQPKDLIPYNTDELYKKIPRIGRTKKMRHVYKPRYDLLRTTRQDNVERYKLQEIAEAFDRDDLRKLANSDIYWDQVKEIEYFGEEQCYDLEIENYHNFIANDIFVHNTSFLSLLLHKEMQRFFLEDGNITLKDKDPDAYEASKKEVVGIDKNSGNFVTLENDGTYNANLLQATQIGGGDYVAVTATNRLFNDKFMGEIRSLFVDKFDIARYHDAARLFELRDPRTGKFWATHSKDKMYGRIMLYSAQQKGGVESVTARAAMVDEFGMPSFTLNIWDGITGRLSLTKKEESTGIPSKFPSGRVFGGSIVYYNGGWPRKEIYDRWVSGDKDYKVVHFDSIMNPFFPIETYETKRRTMSTPRFENRYRGRYAVTAGMIYSDYDPSTHVIDPFDIPADWQRYVGIDPGAVHTATVWAARDPDTDIFYIYRVTLDGNKTTAQHVASALSYGEYVSVWVGGAPSESQFRMDWTDAGIRVQQPPIKDVEAGIDRIVSLFKTNHLRIFKTCTLLLDEIASYSRKLDDMGEPTDVIKDKNKYHTCFVAGTKISTIDGEKNIEDVAIDDLVLTRKGYRPVIGCKMTNDVADVVTAKFSNGSELTGTPDHPIWVEDNGWCRMDALRYSYILSDITMNTWHQKQKQHSITESSFIDTQNPKSGQTKCILDALRDCMKKAYTTCTTKYGNPHMVKSQKDMLSTTKMETHPTTTSRIWNVWNAENIVHSIQSNILQTLKTMKSVLNILPTSVHSRQNGMDLQKELSGIDNTVSTRGSPVNPSKRYVSSAEKNSMTSPDVKTPVFAQTTASPSTGDEVEWTTLNASAFSVERCLQSTNIPHRRHAHINVLPVSVQKLPEKRSVYNLTVYDAHEYYANGILVSNCDAARYLFSKLTKPPTTPATLSSSRFGAKSIPGFGTSRTVPSMGTHIGINHLPCM